jgi:diaminopimelate decarboxylase
MKLSSSHIEFLANEYGPSFYLIDSTRFKENFLLLTESFRSFYEKSTIAYSYKTNYLPIFCNLVNNFGGFAEVVSSMEMKLALKLKVDPKRVFFNGPYKECKYVEKLLMSGGIVNIDSIEELDRIVCIANRHYGEPLKVGIRCNFEVYDGVISRFGFDVDSPVFLDAISIIDSHPKIKLSGLHCHFATRTLNCWENRTKGMLAVIQRYFRHRLSDLSHVSLGGGMYGRMPDELKDQFSVAIPEFKDYAMAAALPFAQYFEEVIPAQRPKLIIEPGTAIVADAMKYVCQVNSIKQIRGRTIITLAGSAYNINPNPNRKNVPIECFPSECTTNRITVKDAYLAGYTCIESDYLYKGFDGNIGVGDFIVFDDVGSYSIVMKPPFILPNVAIVDLIDGGSTWDTIKRSETFEDIFSTYSMG